MSLNASVIAKINANLTKAQALKAASAPLIINESIVLADGKLANQSEQVFSDRRQIAASGTDDIDLNASLVNIYGDSITLNRVTVMMIIAAATNGDVLQVGGAPTNAFVNWVADASDIVQIRPGGFMLLGGADTAGYVVTAATGDILRLSNPNAGGVADYDIVIIGSQP